MGNLCSSDADIARHALCDLTLGGDALRCGDDAAALRHFERGLRKLPFYQYVTSDVKTSAEEAVNGIEEAAVAAAAERGRLAEEEGRMRRQQSRAHLKPPRPNANTASIADSSAGAASSRSTVDADTYRAIAAVLRPSPGADDAARRGGYNRGHASRSHHGDGDAEQMLQYRRVVSHMRRATRVYGNTEVGMQLYDLQRAIGGDARLDAADDAAREAAAAAANPLAAACRSAHNNNSSNTIQGTVMGASVGNAVPAGRRRRTAVAVLTPCDASAPESPQEIVLVDGGGASPRPSFSMDRRRPSALPMPAPPIASVAPLTGHTLAPFVDDVDSSPMGASGAGSVGRSGSFAPPPFPIAPIPSITMTQASHSNAGTMGLDVITVDTCGESSAEPTPRRPAWGAPTVRASLAPPEPSSVLGTHTNGSVFPAKPQRAAGDRLAMSVHVAGGPADKGPVLAAASSIALFHARDSFVIEGILRVLQYRLMMGDHFYANGRCDAADEQYLMVSGASMFVRMKETPVYIQTQTQRIHARACLGISAVALERARSAAAAAATEEAQGESALQTEANRNLAIALQHSISVRRAEAANEEVLADVLRTPYNLSREEHASLRGAFGTDPDTAHLMDAAAIAREELADRVRRQSAVASSLLSGGSLDAHKVRNLLDEQLGTALKCVVGAHSSVVCADGSHLWASVPLIDALRLEAEARLEMILRNNPPEEDLGEERSDVIVGTLEDCQAVISGLQKAVGLCVVQYSTVSPEYRKLKAKLNAARKALRWSPAAFANTVAGVGKHPEPSSSSRRQLSLSRRRSIAVADVMNAVVTRHNNFMAASPQGSECVVTSSMRESDCIEPTTDFSQSLSQRGHSIPPTPSPQTTWLSAQ